MVRLTSSDDADSSRSERGSIEGRGAVRRTLLSPAAKAALLASGAVAGLAAAPGTALAQTNHVTTTPDAGPATNLSNLVDEASSSVGDFDGDGDLDLLVTGYDGGGGTATIYENDGDGNFTNAGVALPGVENGSTSVGDFDGDGDLDILITGRANVGDIARIYENTGGFSFSQVASLTGVDRGDTSVGDFDGDGDLDLLIAGYAGTNRTAKIYENTGQNAGSGSLDGSTFQDVGVSLPGVYKSTSSVGDFDGDGDLDYFLAGDYGPGKITQVVENQSPSTLTITGTDGTGNDVGWRMLSFPSAIQLQDLEDDFGFNFQGISSGNVVHVWDATNQEWSPVTNDTDPIPPEDGIMLYLFDDADDPVESGGFPITTPSVGNARTERTLSGLGGGRFILVGNPYLKAYDLSALSLDANGFQQSVQVYDPATESYQALTPGVDNVAAMQGFVLERKTPGAGATSLTFPTSGIQSGEGTLIKSREAPSAEKASSMRAAALRLTVKDEGGTTVRDRVRVLFHDEAQDGWDAYEATQFAKPGDGPSATLSSPTERNGTLVKRTQASAPVPTKETTVPLSVASDGANGTATLALGDAPEDWTFEVEDTVTGEVTDLGKEAHTFSLSDGDGAVSAPGEARFVLHTTPAGIQSAPSVQALNAQADGSGALLTWEAATKSETEGFEVHRMIGPAGTGMFEKVGFVDADGASSKAQDYRFHTDRLSPGTHRFRLKQVGADGSGTYTESVAVQVRIDGRYRLVPPSPNPSEGQAQIRLAVRESQVVQVAVYDVLGRRVETAFERELSAQSERAISVGQGLPSGTYMVQVKGKQFTATERLTIVK